MIGKYLVLSNDQKWLFRSLHSAEIALKQIVALTRDESPRLDEGDSWLVTVKEVVEKLDEPGTDFHEDEQC